MLAASALAGVTAVRGQERASTQAAERDHSSSDPGQENKPLLDENPDSNMPPPTDHGDMVPLWYSFDLVKKRVQEGTWDAFFMYKILERPADDVASALGLTRANVYHSANRVQKMLREEYDHWKNELRP